MRLIRAMVDQGGAALVVLHDLALAARFADRIIAMEAGRIVADDAPAALITPVWIDRLFGVAVDVDDSAGWPHPRLRY